MKTILIDPACNFLYSSFYIRGLLDLFGKRSFCFSSIPFAGLTYTLHTHIFAFVFNGKKYAIDFADSNQIFYDEFLRWADVYAKVNYNSKYIPTAYTQKIVGCGCNYGMAIYPNRWFAIIVAIKNWVLCHRRVQFSFREYLSRYIMSVKRQSQSTQKSTERNDYIFFVSTLWKGQDKCNQARINFIRACHNLQSEGLITFEGGLILDVQQDVKEVEDVLLKERIPYDEYAKKISQSCCVFNTPAYFDCHGWKLAEYMAMGKIILSTPFVNELPKGMLDKKHILFCDDSVTSMQAAIRSLILDESLREKIKQGISEYYMDYACPEKVIKQIIND